MSLSNFAEENMRRHRASSHTNQRLALIFLRIGKLIIARLLMDQALLDARTADRWRELA